jgi:hypothetical protein
MKVYGIAIRSTVGKGNIAAHNPMAYRLADIAHPGACPTGGLSTPPLCTPSFTVAQTRHMR